ncbi:MAG TPA: hypothetical protein VGF84_12185, partial [Micromonosporaceae bacterium]
DHEAPFLGLTDGAWSTVADFGPWQGGLTGLTAGTGSAFRLDVKSSGTPAPPLTDGSTPQTAPNSNGGTGVEVTVTGNHSPKFVAIGAAGHGLKTGDSTSVTVGVQNTGPAAAATSRSGDPLVFVDVSVPPGTTATAVPVSCTPYVNGKQDFEKQGRPGYAKYRCFVRQNMPVHAKAALAFTLKLTASKTTYTGSVKVYDGGDEPESQRTVLSTARILLNPPASAEPSPSSSSGTPVGGLPVTGNDAGLFAGAGGLLVLLGFGLVVIGRQRRRARHAA